MASDMGRTYFLRAIGEHHAAHVECYGDERIRPKHHYALHCGQQVESDGFALDCFVLERKHVTVKRYGDQVENTRAFEKSVLSSLLLADTQGVEHEQGLLGAQALWAGLCVGRRMCVGAHVFAIGGMCFFPRHILRGSCMCNWRRVGRQAWLAAAHAMRARVCVAFPAGLAPHGVYPWPRCDFCVRMVLRAGWECHRAAHQLFAYR